MTPPELALVVPCYNEAARLDPQEFLRFAATHPTVRLLMIDDGSGDATPEILARMCSAAPASVEALRKPSRSGKAEAVRTGILAGIERRAALVGFLDADLATPLRAIDDFLALLRGRPALEFILGSRVMLLGRDIRRKTTRHYLGRVFATAVSQALDLPVYDTQCGAKVLRVNVATATLFREPFRNPWIFDVELIARYLRLPVAPGEPTRRDRLYELVVPAWHDIPGSKLRSYDFARAAVGLAHIWRERVGHRPPAPTAPAVVPPSPLEARARGSAARPESSRPESNRRGPQRIQCPRPS
jgi:dolichyl-phosphate beta-glucosyltransferase